MQKTDVLMTSMDLARAGLGFTPAAAIDHIAELIAAEDATGEFYDRNVDGLLRLAACIWSLRRDAVAPGPSAKPSGHQPPGRKEQTGIC
ncbi:hypothetical protein [Variovorax paradoxus]|uniref:hypothetical protein n=1 Tax=Variovorax paradoxus TaxID=34073 RepID=UPI000A888BF5|nr:hypothetical protein [Variovorax paradoxus]